MEKIFKPVKITDRVFWVGAIDWNLRDFHGYQTSRGSTYNSYLILADKVTLIDTVKPPFKEEFLQRISSIIDPRQIKYIISNHSEKDHSGSIPAMIELIKPEKVITSVRGVENLSSHFHLHNVFSAVKDGESLSLGNMSLTFYETPMLHWPESQICYLKEERILFSQDGFGMHLATSERFDDQIDFNIMKEEASKYFANILLPYSPLVLKLIERIKKLGLSFDILAPAHGPIWRKYIPEIIKFYQEWALQKPTTKAIIIYDTMWHSTEKMAQVIGEGIVAGGGSVKILSMKTSHRSDIVTELLDAGALIVGSPTLNNNLLPTIADILTYIKGLKPKNLIGAAFGSYGWSGESIKQINNLLYEIGVELIGDGIAAKWVPEEDTLTKCFQLGLEIANQLKSKIKT